MVERALHRFIGEVKAGRLSRRSFVRNMVALGLTAPMASQMLDYCGVAKASSEKFEYKPKKRGGGGALKLLWWQGPTLLNPHFAVGTKDADGSRIFYEPLAGWDPDGDLFPVLASEIPTGRTAGSRRTACPSPGSSSAACTGMTASRSPPTTSCSTAQYAADPATAAVTVGSYKDVKVEKVDDFTVTVRFRASRRRSGPMPLSARAAC